MIRFEEIIERHLDFTSNVFPKGTAKCGLIHLRSEIEEVMAELETEDTADSKLVEEYADCLMCLIDSANRAGITPAVLFRMMEYKICINEDRKWKYNGDGSYSHIKQ